MFKQDRMILQDQQPGGRGVIEIFRQRGRLALEIIGQIKFLLGALQRAVLGGGGDRVEGAELIEMAVIAHDVALGVDALRGADRVMLGGTIIRRIGSGVREHRLHVSPG